MDVCYIPLELQIEIIKRLPIKTLIRFRLVSKPWKSIIESSDFIADYNIHTHHYNHQQILISLYDTDYAYTFDDDDSFPQHKSCLIPSLLNDKPFTYKMIGYSQGLFALYRYHEHDKRDVVIWNPSIRKCVDIPIPNALQWLFETVVGFGVCNTTDPMILKINFISIPWQVEVFKLSTRKWRRLSNTSCLVSGKLLQVCQKAVVTERFIYWLGYDMFDKLILSFDIMNEKFTDISLPPSLADASLDDLDLSKLRESLVLLETIHANNRKEHGVWMMEEDGVHNLFKKLYTIKAPHTSIERVLGFRKNGQPIIQLQNPFKHEIFVYEPASELFNRIGIDGYGYQCFGGSYMGTLLLLDH